MYGCILQSSLHIKDWFLDLLNFRKQKCTEISVENNH